MPSIEEPSSPSNGFASADSALAYYKTQYEQLESELADFQASSRELETELEKDIEASERRERQLKEKAESLGYEVEEWKTKYKQAKVEANTAQNNLQKEITALRDTNRTIHLKLRDIEVANDDFERQARHTTSSLEDLEHKYNVAIERGVMLEEEIKMGEQERETLRIETQRLRDELSDLKVEAEISKEKLRRAEIQLEDSRRKPMPTTPVNLHRNTELQSSPMTNSSPSLATPTNSVNGGLAAIATPPSPPTSESSGTLKGNTMTPLFQRARLSMSDISTTPRPPTSSIYHNRRPSIPRRNPSVSLSRRNTVKTTSPDAPPVPGLPRSGSLYQIRGLIGKMQKLEERVQNVRSRLPAPVNTPPRASPRSGSAMGHSYIPSSITVRSTRSKRTSVSNASEATKDSDEGTPSGPPRSRPSLGMGPPPQTPSYTAGESRPSSRASLSSRSSLSHASALPQPSTATTTPARPDSRQGLSGRRTPFGHRPRSSLSGYSHANSMSVGDVGEEDEPEYDMSISTPRRSTFQRPESRTGTQRPESRTGIQRPESRTAVARPESRTGGMTLPRSSTLSRMPTSPVKKRVVSMAAQSTRRPSSSGLMAPPARKISEVGETY